MLSLNYCYAVMHVIKALEMNQLIGEALSPLLIEPLMS